MTYPDTLIRDLRRDDLPMVKTVIDRTGMFPPEMLDAMTSGYLDAQGDGGEFWLTTEDRNAVAYCAPERMTDGSWNLLLIAVDPDRQGHGIGTALMARVERMLVERGHRLLLVETSGLPAFAATRGFYASLGYQEEARIRDYYQAGEDKIVFRKALLELAEAV